MYGRKIGYDLSVKWIIYAYLSAQKSSENSDQKVNLSQKTSSEPVIKLQTSEIIDVKVIPLKSESEVKRSKIIFLQSPKNPYIKNNFALPKQEEIKLENPENDDKTKVCFT